MKDLVKKFLDKGISRRKLTTGLTAAGMTTVAAKAMAQSLAAPSPQAAAAAPASVRDMKGTGGALFTQQLKAAGVEYIFFNPSTADAPIFDSLVNEPSIQLIKGVQEGAVVAKADGYSRATGKLGVAIVANVGLPNALCQMVNSWKDQIPILLAAASVSQESVGREQFQEYEHIESMTQPITKWNWVAAATDAIPETARRAIKYATTAPSGPVYLSFPENLLRTEGQGQIYDGALFNVPMTMRPDKADIERAARMLIEAKSPVLSFGDEVTLCKGEKELVELCELLGIPAAGGNGALGFWSKPFPTKHPLYIGAMLRQMRFPQNIDVHINLGWKHGEIYMPGVKQISIRRDPASIARNAPVDLPMIADIRLATIDLIDAIKSLATKERLKLIADERLAKVRDYTSEQAKLIQKIAADHADGGAIRMERLGAELEQWLDKDAIYVCDVDSGKRMDPFMSFGGDDKRYIGTGPNILGWGMAAGLGVKLANPDKQVLSVVGDGSFLFSGPQPLWSLSRYQAPTTSIVLNNKSYNNERNRIWMSGGAQFKAGRDMTCYLGSPDVDYAMVAKAFGVDGENVKDASQIKDALARAKKANMDGRPYLLDVNIQRDGVGSASAWHPEYSIASKRTRKV
jgi:thiamine pyrophosphate-dependent acetolactate synthase large subunit-like protein